MPKPPQGFEIDVPAGFTMDSQAPVQTEETKVEEPGILDALSPLFNQYIDFVTTPYKYLAGGAELAAMAGTGAVAQPLSGIAGMAKTITSGPEEGAKTVEEMQQALTYQPKGDVATSALEMVGTGMQKAAQLPGVKQTIEGAKSFQDMILEKYGPLAATGTSLIPPAIIEVAGLKGSRAVKKAMMKKALNRIDKTQFYDELGNLTPVVKKQIEEVGLQLDDVADVLPQNVNLQKMAEPLAGEIKGAAKKTALYPESRMAGLAQQIEPDLNRIQAFEALDVDYLPSHVSQNPTYVAVEQNLGTIAGSMLAPKQKAIISDLAKRADELIIQGGGEIEKGLVSDRFRTESKNLIDQMGKESSNLYASVSDQMPKNTVVKTENVMAELNAMQEEVGGHKFLDPIEKRLINALDPETNPTYGRLDKFRKQIGDQKRGIDTPFKNADKRTLNRLYDAMTKDQESSLLDYGDEDLLKTYLTGKYLTAQRKGIEEQLITVLGKDLKGDLAQKVRPAILDLQKGYTKRFDEVLDNIPKELGPDLKKSVVVTSLNDAFAQQSRAERSLNIAGFDDWMKGVKRNPRIYKKLTDILGPDTAQRLELLHTAAGGVRDAQRTAVLTGRTISTPGLFDESSNIAKRLYGEAVKPVSRLPGLGGFIGDALGAAKTARSTAADELLSSAKFRNIVKDYAAGNIDTPKRMENASKIVEKLDKYKKWKNTLSSGELEELGTVTALGYLMGQEQ